MPKMEDLDDAFIVIESVVNQERTVQKFPNPRSSADDAAHAGKAGE